MVSSEKIIDSIKGQLPSASRKRAREKFLEVHQQHLIFKRGGDA